MFQIKSIKRMLKHHKILLILIIYFVSSEWNFAQNLFPSNQYNNLIFENPAVAGINDFTLFQFNYRNHWPVDNIYNTYGASVFHSLNNLNSNLGLILNHDRQYRGYLTNTSIGFNYAYRFKIAYRNYLSMGMSGSYSFQNLNYNQLTFENPGTVLPGNETNQYPILNAGAVLTLQKTHHIGAAIINIYPFTEQPVSARKLNVFYFSHYELKSYSAVPGFYEPIFAIDLTQDMLQFKYGVNLGIYNFKAGALVSQTGIHINTATFLLGILFENYEFIYCYDLNLSTSVSVNPKMAAHEVTFLNKIQYKGRSKRKGAIKCPKI